MTDATTAMTRSPSRWPWVSLTFLKWSMSMNRQEHFSSSAGLEGAQPEVQPAAVQQARQRIGLGLALGDLQFLTQPIHLLRGWNSRLLRSASVWPRTRSVSCSRRADQLDHLLRAAPVPSACTCASDRPLVCTAPTSSLALLVAVADPLDDILDLARILDRSVDVTHRHVLVEQRVHFVLVCERPCRNPAVRRVHPAVPWLTPASCTGTRPL